MAKMGRDADDMIASLMHEMGQQQLKSSTDHRQDDTGGDCGDGGDPGPSNRQPGRDTTTAARPQEHQQRRRHRRRQLQELSGYPDNTFQAGSQSIWNPLVVGDSGDSRFLASDGRRNERQTSPPSSLPILLPTNPRIEVMRRRVFEKFRQEVQTLLQEFQTKHLSFVTSGKSGGSSSSSFSKNKSRLPIPSMIEKWHMDAKLEEKNHLLRKHPSAKRTHARPSSASSSSSVADILRERMSRQQHDGVPVYDPVLLGRHAPTIFVENVLTPQVRKLWEQHRSAHDSAIPMPPKFGKKAKQLQKALYRLVCEAIDSFESQLAQGARDEALRSTTATTRRKGFRGGTSATKRPKITFLEGSGDIGSSNGSATSMVKVTFSGVTLKLHRAYLEKLQRLYDRSNERQQQQQQQQPSPNDRYHQLSFEEALFCLLCRYDVIQGAGLQAGVPGAIMDVLLERFDCRMECFASPLNCRYDRFASAFPDVDAPFGSVGSFFELPFLKEDCHGDRGEDEPPPSAEDGDGGGDDTNNGKADPCGSTIGEAEERNGICYEANPPFCDGLILQLDRAITRILSSEGRRGIDRVPIMFVVFVPAWREAECYRALLANRCLTKHLLLKQGEHWYTEGTQHRRKDSFRVASFDTSILFYQNEAAKQLWNLEQPEGDDGSPKRKNQLPVFRELIAAFGQDPGTMQKEHTSADHPRTTVGTKRFVPRNNTESATSAREPPADRQPPPSVDRSASPVPKQARKPTKKAKKRRWNPKEEGKAQLALLESLGLSSPPTTTTTTTAAAAAAAQDTVSDAPKPHAGGKAGRKKKKRRKK